MTAASTTKSVQHILEDLILAGGDTDTSVKGIIQDQVTSSNPADFDPVDTASAIVTATATLTGVAVGDAVLAVGYVSGLAAGQIPVDCYVSATDTVTFVFSGAEDAAVTTTAVVANVIVLDLT